VDARSANRLPRRMNELHQDEPQKNDPKKNDPKKNDPKKNDPKKNELQSNDRQSRQIGNFTAIPRGNFGISNSYSCLSDLLILSVTNELLLRCGDQALMDSSVRFPARFSC
jgi:hypothetical protein